jgi:NADH:ubiquinone oxidoreductase subunit 3 (subunit A)
MSGSHSPLLILLGASVANAIGRVVVSHILDLPRPTPRKAMPNESGMTPLGVTSARFSGKLHVATVFFMAVLAVGLLYEGERGGLEWA